MRVILNNSVFGRLIDRSRLEAIVREAGRIALATWPGHGHALESWEKDAGSPVSAADLAVDHFLKRELSALLPAAEMPDEATRPDPFPFCSFRCQMVDLGRWIDATDWYPDYQTRLYDRTRARWSGQYVHEAVTVDGSRGRLTGRLQPPGGEATERGGHGALQGGEHHCSPAGVPEFAAGR